MLRMICECWQVPAVAAADRTTSLRTVFASFDRPIEKLCYFLLHSQSVHTKGQCE